MRYFLLLLVVLAMWAVLKEFLLKDRGAEGLQTYGDKWRDLGRRLHFIFGVLAVLLLVLMLLRFFVRGFDWF